MIEFPREHDVSDVLMNVEWKGFDSPIWFIERVERLGKIMREMTPKRGPAMYGFEKEMKPAKDLFFREDRIKATTNAKFVYETCQRFLQEWKR